MDFYFWLMKETLFSGRLPITTTHVETPSTLKCDVVRTHDHLEVRLTDVRDIFNIYYAYITPAEYLNLKREQDLRVDYERFTQKLVEMLSDAVQGKLVLVFARDGSKLVVLERNEFRNIVRLEIRLSRPDDVQFRRYAADLLNRLEMENSRCLKENALLKEDLRSREADYKNGVSRMEAELMDANDRYSRLRRDTEQQESDLGRLRQEEGKREAEALRYKEDYMHMKAEYNRLNGAMSTNTALSEKLQERERKATALEEEVRKGNEILRKLMEDLKERKKSEERLSDELDEEGRKRLLAEAELEKATGELMEKSERLQSLEQIGRERKEVIESLKKLNEGLRDKLENAHQIYARIYASKAGSSRRAERRGYAEDSEAEDYMKSEESSSVILPETLP